MIEPRRPIGVDSVVDHYQELDRFYREQWGEHIHHGLWRSGAESPIQAVEQMVTYVADQAGIGPGDRVCDIGSGYGASARYLAKHRHAWVTALTVVPAQHAFAEAATLSADNPRYLLRDWLENQLAAQTFDAAYAIESTEHMADKARAFHEMFRVLRPGGRMVICAWIAAGATRPWQRRHLLEPICREGRLPGMGTAGDYRALLESAGFTVEAVTDLTANVQGTWGICLRRAIARLGRDANARAFLLSAASRNRVFLLTMARIWLAYQSGAMRYLVFRARRPEGRIEGCDRLNE
jgi:tocopherol O-methyltransferase